jgi:hypothetical protein
MSTDAHRGKTGPKEFYLLSMTYGFLAGSGTARSDAAQARIEEA